MISLLKLHFFADLSFPDLLGLTYSTVSISPSLYSPQVQCEASFLALRLKPLLNLNVFPPYQMPGAGPGDTGHVIPTRPLCLKYSTLVVNRFPVRRGPC